MSVKFKCKPKTSKTKPITYICRDCECKRTVRLPENSIVPGSFGACSRCGGTIYTPMILAAYKHAQTFEDPEVRKEEFKKSLDKIFKEEI